MRALTPDAPVIAGIVEEFAHRRPLRVVDAAGDDDCARLNRISGCTGDRREAGRAVDRGLTAGAVGCG